MKTQYRSREGYKNIQIGRARMVYARGKDSSLRNLTLYLHLGNSYMFDIVASKWDIGFNFNVI